MPASRGFAAVGSPERDVHDHRMIGVDYPFVDFPGKESTIEAVRELLQNSVSLSSAAPDEILAGQTFPLQVSVNNDRTGHDVPTGNIIDRQMWLEVIVTDAMTDETIFSSGHLDANGDLMNHHSAIVAADPTQEDDYLVLFNGIAFDENDEETKVFLGSKTG